MNKYLFSAITVFVLTAYNYPQSNVNPDISLIGTFDMYTNFIKDSPEYHKLNFATPSMEMLVEGYLNPFARASAVISYEDDKFFIEELYALVERGLPLDLQVKAGKYLVGFGKLNTVHPHAWPFLERPLFHQIYFGAGGFNDIGVNLSIILPTGDTYTNLDIGIYKGDAIGKSEASNPDDPESIKALRGISPVFAGRLGSFFNLGDFSNLEAGLSASYGLHSRTLFNVTGNQQAPFEIRSLYYTYLGADVKYKYKPDSYTALTIQGEGLFNHRDVSRPGKMGVNSRMDTEETINTFGAFVFADYLFNKQFSVGAKYDFTYGIIGDFPSEYTGPNDDKNKTNAVSEWFAYYPVEETIALRLEAQHLFFTFSDQRTRSSETKLTLQLLFSLGPHKAHPF